MILDSQEFYNFHMTEYLQQEYLLAGSALVQVFKDGRQYVTKKSVQSIHPKIKDDLASFVLKHPEVLETYKNLKGADGPLSADELSRILEIAYFDERHFARALLESLDGIAPGPANAENYHTFAMGVCSFLFYPKLIPRAIMRDSFGIPFSSRL